MSFPVTITEPAARILQSMLTRKGTPEDHIRIGVKGGGCSGLEYVIRIDSLKLDGDLMVQIGDLTVVCDPKSAEFLEGSTLDVSGNLIGGGLQFDNPNAARSCGCGTSFFPIDQSKSNSNTS